MLTGKTVKTIKTIKTIKTGRFVIPYFSQSGYSQSASLLAHNRIAASQLIRLNASFRMPFVPSYSDAAP